MTGLLETVRLIIQSEPQRLNDFAERWAAVAAAAFAQETVVTRAVQDVEFRSQGRTAQQLTPYRVQTADGLTKLGVGALEVSDALRQIAPRIAAIRASLVAAVAGGVLTGVAATVPNIPKAVQVLLGGGEIATLLNLVNNYFTEMTTLQTAMVAAGARMEVLDTLQAAGGVVPPPPRLTPG